MMYLLDREVQPFQLSQLTLASSNTPAEFSSMCGLRCLLQKNAPSTHTCDITCYCFKQLTFVVIDG